MSATQMARAMGLQQSFSTRFGRALPVSAGGQTIAHDGLGLDHHAIDVAIHPDSAEGRMLIEYLRGEHAGRRGLA